MVFLSGTQHYINILILLYYTQHYINILNLKTVIFFTIKSLPV